MTYTYVRKAFSFLSKHPMEHGRNQYPAYTQSILKEPRNKWFRDAKGSCSNSLMADAFDNSIIAWQVWENIRKLTCVICGKQYVRHLEKDDHAGEIAKELCQFVYDLRMRQKERK